MLRAASSRTRSRVTDRERSVLDLLAQGRRTADIAPQLYLFPKTVSNRPQGRSRQALQAVGRVGVIFQVPLDASQDVGGFAW